MSLSFLIAKYVDDLARNEPVNVGVIVFDEQRAVARFQGEALDKGTFDFRRMGKKIGAPRTFKSWVDYWRRALDDPSALGVEASSVSEVIETLLRMRQENFFLQHGGTILADASDATLEETRDRLYERLVAPPHEHRQPAVEAVEPEAPARAPLGQRSMTVLDRAGAPIHDASRFKRNFPLTVTIGGVDDTEEVSYAVMNGTWHYVQEVAFDPEDGRRTRRDAHLAALVIESGKVGKESMFLYEGDRVTAETKHLLAVLNAVAPAVDVTDEDRAAELLRTQLRLD